MKAKILEQLKQRPMKIASLCMRIGVEYREIEKHMQTLRKDGVIRFDRKIGWQIAPALEGCDRAQTCDEADLYAEAADREKARADAAEARARELEAMVADRGRERDAAQEAAGSAERKWRELEAQCAAMREALQSVAVNTCEACVCRDIKCECDCSDRLRYESARAALSGDAGRALMERVEAQDRRIAALERVANTASALVDALDEFGTLNGMGLSVDAVADALDALEPKR